MGYLLVLTPWTSIGGAEPAVSRFSEMEVNLRSSRSLKLFLEFYFGNRFIELRTDDIHGNYGNAVLKLVSPCQD